MACSSDPTPAHQHHLCSAAAPSWHVSCRRSDHQLRWLTRLQRSPLAAWTVRV
jgi:hypothetical protein